MLHGELLPISVCRPVLVRSVPVCGYWLSGPGKIENKLLYGEGIRRFQITIIGISDLLEISIHSKFKLVYKDFFKGTDIIHFVEDQHSFFIFHGVDSAKGNRTIAVRN